MDMKDSITSHEPLGEEVTHERSEQAAPLKGGKGQDTSGQTEELGTGSWESGGTSVWLNGGRGGGRVGTVGWGLELSVRDLGDWGTGANWALDLSVGDLGDWGSGGGWALDLSVRDLGNWGTSGGLDLSVRDLGNRGSGGGLDLSVRDLGDWGGSAGVVLDLSVGDLASDRADRGGGDLSVGHLGGDSWGSGELAVRDLRGTTSGSTGTDDVDVDWGALSRLVVVVQVVEGTAQALVEDGGVTKGESAVGASGETGSELGTSLRRTVKLELVVGGNVTSASLGVSQNTVGHGDLESSGALGGGGDIDDGDLKGAWVVGSASCWSSLLRSHSRADGGRVGVSGASEGDGCDE